MEKIKTTKNKKSNVYLTWIILGMVVGILLECLLTVRAGCLGEWQERTILDLESMINEEKLELTDCTVEDGSILSEDANSMMIFHGTQDWGQIRLTFREPVTGPATAEWYNSPSEDDKFDRFRRQEGYIMPGKDKAKINLSGKDNGNLRLNIHGNFRLGSIEVAERISVKALSFGIILGHFNWLRLILFMFLGASGFCLLKKERKQTKTETRHVSKKEKRYVYLDGIRILAAILVIIVHVIEPLALLYPMGSKRYILLKLLSAVSLSCNLLFVMISGALLLEWKEEGWAAFFKKRFLKVLIPLAVYGMLYEKGCCISQTDLFSWIRHSIQTFISGDFTKGPHLWLIYVLLGLYITVIPFRYMLREMKEPAKKALAVMILICLSVNTYGKISGQEIGISVFLGNWPGIFLMGYLINQTWMRKYDKALLGAGMAAFAVSGWIVTVRENCMDVIANQSILSMLMASAIYVIFLHGDQLLAPGRKVLASISRYSYSIILIHWYILIRVVHNGWFHSGMNQYLQVILPILWCALLSVVSSWVIDRFLVDIILERLKNIKC